MSSEGTTLKKRVHSEESFVPVLECKVFAFGMFCFVCFHLISCVQSDDIWITNAFFSIFFFKITPRVLCFPLSSEGVHLIYLIANAGVDNLTIPIFQIRKDVSLWL